MLGDKSNLELLAIYDYITDGILPFTQSDEVREVCSRILKHMKVIEDLERADFIERQTFKPNAIYVNGYGWLK